MRVSTNTVTAWITSLLLIATATVYGAPQDAPTYVAGELVIGLEAGYPVDSINMEYGTVDVQHLPQLDVFLLNTTIPIGLDSLAELMAEDPNVLFCHPNYTVDPLGPVQGTLPFGDLTGGSEYFNQPASSLLDLPSAHGAAMGEGVTVGIIDGGVDVFHPLLEGNAVSGWDYVDDDSLAHDELGGANSGHGTFVAGVLHLVAPEATIRGYRVTNLAGHGNGYIVAEAILQAVEDGCDIINISLQMMAEHRAIAGAIQYAENHNVLTVVAGGNWNEDMPCYPASDPNALTVAAVDSVLHLADFSNFGDYIDICAPGTSIYSTFVDSTFAWWGGTSFATPFVSGQAALLRSAVQSLTNEETRSLILNTATDIGDENPGMEGLIGSGLLNPFASVTLALNPAEVIYVPGDFATIQEAIDASKDGDTVLVGPGMYEESIVFGGKLITVASTNGPLETVITRSDYVDLVTFQDGETVDAVIEGFTLLGGRIGVRCRNSGPTIRGNILRNQTIDNWGAISLGGTDYATPGPCPAMIVNNTIVGAEVGGISTFSTVPPTIMNNNIAFNDEYGIHRQPIPEVPQPVHSYNNVYGHGAENYAFVDNPVEGSISQDPLLSPQQTLMEGSPCIDAGNPDPSYNDPDGSRNDMGAVPYEETEPHTPITLHVPSEYPTISSATFAAWSSDTILVADGVYEESVDFFGKSVVLVSEGGAEVTTILAPSTSTSYVLPEDFDTLAQKDGSEYRRTALSQSSPAVITMVGGSDASTLISGFTIDGGGLVRGIYGEGVSPTVSNCIVQNCLGDYDGGGIFFQHGAPTIRDNIIRNNQAPISGGGIFVRLGSEYGAVVITDNVIHNNVSGNGPAISLIEGDDALVEGNFCYSNTATPGSQRRGAIYFRGLDVDVINNTIVGNTVGVTALSTQSCDVRNNIIANNSMGGFEGLEEVGPNIDLTYDYNDVWGNGIDDYLNLSPGANDISADPAFEPTLPGQFYLSLGSPCIDAGDPDPAYNDPDGSRNDMGARPYEFVEPYTPITIHVPSEYPTIQAGIDVAVHFDTVLVAPGVYEESISFNGKLIIVSSSDGPLVTSITGDPSTDLVVFSYGETSQAVLEGFSLVGGRIGVLCENSGPTINRNLFVGQSITTWGAISLGGHDHASVGNSPAVITNNTIVYCSNGGISTFSINPPVIMNNIIAFNAHYGIHREGWIPGVAQPMLSYNDVYGNLVNYQEIDDVGVGTISTNPLFAPTLQLMEGSPCIDAGNPDGEYDDPDGSKNDMGAMPYEELAPHTPIALLVPSEYSTIQSAVMAAYNLDTILVADGLYEEAVNFFGKSIVLISVGGADVTTIMAPGASLTYSLPENFDSLSSNDGAVHRMQALLESTQGVITMVGGSDNTTVINGFTIDGGGLIRGIFGDGVSPEVSDCIIENCVGSYDAGGIFFQFGAPAIRDNIIRNNFAPISGGGIFVRLGDEYGMVEITGNEIYGNISGNGPAMSLIEGDQAIVDRNFCYHNRATAGSERRGAIYFRGLDIFVTNNTIANNTVGVTALSSQGCDVRNNIIVNNSSGGFEALEDTGPNVNFTFDYNDVWGNGVGDYLNLTPGDNDISVDPEFVHCVSGYYLSEGSPCRDAGDPDPQYNDPDGSRNDMGARPYEEGVTPYEPKSFYVPGEYATIQEAIDVTVCDDTVVVAPGMYEESLDFGGRAIVVRSSDGPLVTTITGDESTDLVVFSNNETPASVLEGFGLTGGRIGVLCEDAAPTIRNNLFVGQNIIDWGAISLGGSGYATYGHSPAVIVNNTIVFCANGGISTFSVDPPVIMNNIIAFNSHYGIHREGWSPIAQPLLSYNDVYGNMVAYQEIEDTGIGTISEDPLFGEGFSLQDGSPCIDAGNPDSEYNDPDGTRNDMGAVPSEYGSPPACDSLLIPSVVVYPSDNECVVQPVSISACQPLRGGTIPLAIPAGAEICSLSTAGLITESWDYVFTGIDNDAGWLYLSMANSFGAIIPEGNNTVFNIYFRATPGCPDSDFLHWDKTVILQDAPKLLIFVDASVVPQVILPGFDPARDSTEIAGYTPGDADGSTDVDIADLIRVVDWMFTGGEVPAVRDAVDVNGDCLGPDIADLVFMVDFMFIPGTPEMLCGCAAPSAPALLDATSSISIFAEKSEGNTILVLESSFDIRGLQLELEGEEDSEITNLTGEGIDLVEGNRDGRTLVGLLDLDGSSVIQKGRRQIVQLRGDFEIVSARAADRSYRSTPVQIKAFGEGAILPSRVTLSQNYPNPFNPSTEIRFALPDVTAVRLDIFNVMGQRVETLVDSRLPAGEHSFVFNGAGYASGVYLYQLVAGDVNVARKMILMK